MGIENTSGGEEVGREATLHTSQSLRENSGTDSTTHEG